MGNKSGQSVCDGFKVGDYRSVFCIFLTDMAVLRGQFDVPGQGRSDFTHPDMVKLA